MRNHNLYGVKALVIALCMGVCFASTSYAAADPCKSVSFSEGNIKLGIPLQIEETLSSEASQCMVFLAKRIKEQREVRTVTVVARVSDALRVKGLGLRAAKAYMKQLIAGGVSEYRVSAVSPGTAPGESDVLLLTYTQKRTTKPIAVLTSVHGDVQAGKNKASLEPVKNGQTLASYTYLRTGSGSSAGLTLADGSHIHLDSDTTVLLGRMWLNEKMDREVRINLLKGNFAVDVTKGGTSSNFDVVTPNAVAGVRGTQFRVYYDEKGMTRLETLDGTVELKGSKGTVWVNRGQGSRVLTDGAPEKPRQLLLAGELVFPLKGGVSAGVELKWKPVKGAVKYDVRIARDAEFTSEIFAAVSDKPLYRAGAAIVAGKWFWRVIAVDKDGYRGLPSKIYSFELK